MVILYMYIISFLSLCLSFGYLGVQLCVGMSFSLVFDWSCLVFMLTLISISFSVLIWSYFYLYSESDFRRFLILILLFLASMFILVCSADLLRLFVAWDLLGFTSVFLVFFYRSRSALGGGLLTGLSNRLGDVLFLGLFGFVLITEQSHLSC